MCTTKGTQGNVPRTPSSQPHTPHGRLPPNGNPLRTGNLAHHPTTTQTGLVTPPLPPRRIHRHTHSTKTATTPLDKLPIHTPTEYQLIEELVKLNKGTSQQPMTTAKQDTLKASVVYDAQTRLKAYLTKHPNLAVTTEHIRRQTQEGVWYDRNTYQLPLFAQHKLRNVMTVMH